MKLHDNVDEMGMTDMVYNQFFVKDREAWHRNFSSEISCRNLVREICSHYSIDLEEGNEDDDAFDEILLDWLQDGVESMEGLIAMYYTAMWGMAEMREKLIANEGKVSTE